MKKLVPLILALALLFSACRGGGLVFKGTHEDQDAALLERLMEDYPEMTFSCTGQVEGSRHSIEAGDGTQFLAWTAAKSKGEFQVLEYYLEEWLAAQGFYSELEEKLAEMGFEWDYSSYNYYDRHFNFRFGGLDRPERVNEAAQALSWAKERFDQLYADFQAGTGCESPLLYFNGSFTLAGEEHFKMFYLSMRPDDVWNFAYAYDDYQGVLQDAIEHAWQADDPSAAPARFAPTAQNGQEKMEFSIFSAAFCPADKTAGAGRGSA